MVRVAPLWALNTIKKICAPRESAPNFSKNFRGCYPLRPPIMPNLIEIGQTSLEKGGALGLGQKNYFVTDGQKRDYLSVREARLKTDKTLIYAFE